MEQTKKKYHYPADLKLDLLEKGIEIIQEKGIDGLTLKSLAGSLGVTSAAMYHHYPDKTALLVAIVQKHLDALRKELDEKAYEPLKNEADKLLVKAAMVFYNFCEEHPDFLSLVAGDIVKSWSSVDAVKERIDYLFSIPLSAIKEGQTKGSFIKGKPETLLTMFFSTVYGFSAVMFNRKIDLADGVGKEGRNAFFEVVCSSLSTIKGSNNGLHSEMKVFEKSFVN